ncbi:MAG: hypothetical protein NT169_06010 [Chloroflexi bacterium]|nr:hypothetical protein [Chloroflexota bacterium]
MSDYLDRLIARSVGLAAGYAAAGGETAAVQPRPVSLFEPEAGGARGAAAVSRAIGTPADAAAAAPFTTPAAPVARPVLQRMPDVAPPPTPPARSETGAGHHLAAPPAATPPADAGSRPNAGGAARAGHVPPVEPAPPPRAIPPQADGLAETLGQAGTVEGWAESRPATDLPAPSTRGSPDAGGPPGVRRAEPVRPLPDGTPAREPSPTAGEIAVRSEDAVSPVQPARGSPIRTRPDARKMEPVEPGPTTARGVAGQPRPALKNGPRLRTRGFSRFLPPTSRPAEASSPGGRFSSAAAPHAAGVSALRIAGRASMPDASASGESTADVWEPPPLFSSAVPKGSFALAPRPPWTTALQPQVAPQASEPGPAVQGGPALQIPPVPPSLTPQAAPPQIAPASQAPPVPTIRVTIGRVEVRAVMPQPPIRLPAATGLTLSLDDYLKQRKEGGR